MTILNLHPIDLSIILGTGIISWVICWREHEVQFQFQLHVHKLPNIVLALTRHSTNVSSPLLLQTHNTLIFLLPLISLSRPVSTLAF